MTPEQIINKLTNSQLFTLLSLVQGEGVPALGRATEKAKRSAALKLLAAGRITAEMVDEALASY